MRAAHCEGLVREDAAARAEVRQFERVLHDEQVFGLDVAVEDAVAVHVVDGFEQLVDVVLHAALGDVVAPSLDRLVHIHVHQLENQRQAAGRLVAGSECAPTRAPRAGGLCAGAGTGV